MRLRHGFLKEKAGFCPAFCGFSLTSAHRPLDRQPLGPRFRPPGDPGLPAGWDGNLCSEVHFLPNPGTDPLDSIPWIAIPDRIQVVAMGQTGRSASYSVRSNSSRFPVNP